MRTVTHNNSSRVLNVCRGRQRQRNANANAAANVPGAARRAFPSQPPSWLRFVLFFGPPPSTQRGFTDSDDLVVAHAHKSGQFAFSEFMHSFIGTAHGETTAGRDRTANVVSCHRRFMRRCGGRAARTRPIGLRCEKVAVTCTRAQGGEAWFKSCALPSSRAKSAAWTGGPVCR